MWSIIMRAIIAQTDARQPKKSDCTSAPGEAHQAPLCTAFR
ncbi:hypothetical protein WMF39_33400 [Sorangium sp. So ce1504]